MELLIKQKKKTNKKTEQETKKMPGKCCAFNCRLNHDNGRKEIGKKLFFSSPTKKNMI